MARFQLQQKVTVQWSPNFAYAIGLIASDGNLSSDGRHISLKSADRELVENLKAAFSLSNKICERIRYRGKLQTHYVIAFGDVIFYRFLNEIGICAKKSKTIKQVAIPDEFFSDFLRGLFDGDGTFYTSWDPRWPNSFVFQISFASASLPFMQWLKITLTRFYGVKGFIRNGDGVFNLRYVKGDTRKLFVAMYRSDTNLFLGRKRFKIEIALRDDPGVVRLQKAAVAQW